jgi:hypothetical protein
LHTTVCATSRKEKLTVPIAKFMSSPAGRLTRVALGVVLVALGYSMHSTGGTVLAVVGLVPIAAGAFDVCLLGPAFGLPLSGRGIRDAGGN